MTVRELIKRLSCFDGNLEVTTSNKMGLFQSVDDVVLQEWSNNTFSSATLVLGKYDNKKCIVNEDKINESRVDNEFIDNVNRSSNNKINKMEALNLKAYFVNDYGKYKEKFKDSPLDIYRDEFHENVVKKYNETMEDAMMELFGTKKPLDRMTLSELKKIYGDDLNEDVEIDRNDILQVLYTRLNEKIKDVIISETNFNKCDIIPEEYNVENSFNDLTESIKQLVDSIKNYNKDNG